MSVLLIKTMDERSFVTDPNNFPQLIEFAKTVGAEISLVKAEEQVEVLELSALVKSLCDVTKGTKPIKCEVLERKIAGNPSASVTVTRNRANKREIMLKLAQEVRAHLYKELVSGATISMSGLTNRFGDKLSASALRSHLNIVKNRLSLAGCKTEKVGVGQYKVVVFGDKPLMEQAGELA